MSHLPKGHKAGCQCVICARVAPKRAKRNHGYENQMNTLHAKAARSTRRNSTVRMPNPRIAGNPGSNQVLVDELRMWADTSSEPVYTALRGVHKSLINKLARDRAGHPGTFDYAKARKAFQNVANFAAQEFQKQMRGRRLHGSYGEFSPADRKALAGEWLDHWNTAKGWGEYDDLLAKKYQANPRRKTGLTCKRTGGRKMRVNSQLNTRRTAVANKGHYPRTGRGPKGNDTWFIFDLFNGKGELKSTRIKKLTKAAAHTEAAGLVDRKVGKFVSRKVELAGPYSRKPTANTVRK